MTAKEREKPDIINASRKRRIAAGSGMRVEDVNKLLNQYDQMKKMFRQMSAKGGKRKMMRGMRMPGGPKFWFKKIILFKIYIVLEVCYSGS